jgi:hypothetical protein
VWLPANFRVSRPLRIGAAVAAIRARWVNYGCVAVGRPAPADRRAPGHHVGSQRNVIVFDCAAQAGRML